jgi:hypothetical protein
VSSPFFKNSRVVSRKFGKHLRDLRTSVLQSGGYREAIGQGWSNAAHGLSDYSVCEATFVVRNGSEIGKPVFDLLLYEPKGGT